MAKELYLYSGIYNYVAESLIASLEENKGVDIVIRANTPGGSVFAGWGIIAKMKEHEGNITIKVDGSVASMGSTMLLYADTVEALDVSTLMIHKADMYVQSPEDQAFLDLVNKDLKAKYKAKINNEKLKELKGISIDDLFNEGKRIDVWLTAKEAKEINLVDKIIKLNPKEIEALNDKFFLIGQDSTVQKINHKTMTIETLRAEHPALYAQVISLGVTQEKDRAGAWLAFNDIDPESVSKGIKSGENISQTAMAELTRKSLNVTALKDIKADSAAQVTTDEVAKEKTDKEKAIEAFEAESKKLLNLK